MIWLALTRLTQHKFAELLTLDFAISFICKLADVLGEHRLLRQLLRVVLLDLLDLLGVG